VAVLTQELERLWRSYHRRPCDATRNQLVESYQPLVREIVRRFERRLPKSVDRDDLAIAANVGLMAAIEGFDRNRGVRFEAYCELRVRGALLDEMRSQDWLPRPLRARLEQQRRAVEELRGALNRDPHDEEVAELLCMEIDAYRLAFGPGLTDAPQASVGPDDSGADSARGLDVLPAAEGDGPDEKLTQDDLLTLVAQRLTKQEHQLVYLKYWEELSMREIGELMRLSESRVCKIHSRLLDRLKDRFRVEVEV
jgi:RNA polymerase sigma factor for flagellar operon FliA